MNAVEEVDAHVSSNGKQWLLRVLCPFCSCAHRHGGGEVSAPVIEGSRSAHCGKGIYRLFVQNGLSKKETEGV